MMCPNCREDAVMAVVHLRYRVPLQRGGTIKPPKISVAEVQQLWDDAPDEAKEMVCGECETSLRYINGKLEIYTE